ncbi:CRISPR-associated endonuclease Cas1 [Pararhodospirillum oryzae]|uniref:CRISPR-associated endonuclease Cas1 n=1 Tax=Pararhodospirillum oryzae TaxID=478448 RepID=A0A512H682_9PROT|nr:CRISPR-associated endonuclease Cas1 [Pararhodospirillum oryzae]GEO80951.1 hypothetical protein ROR02_10820 [Pararhodospirillum oryzae]
MWRVVDIAGDGRILTLSHQRLAVAGPEGPLGLVPLSDIQSIVVHGHGAMVSAALVARLAEEGIPLVVCGSNHLPVACCVPVVGHFEQADRLAAQTTAALPVTKRLWKQVVGAKIRA